MQQRMLNFTTGRPAMVFWLTGLLTLLIGAQMVRINIDTDPENMLPVDQADRVFHNQVEEMFTLHDAIVVGLVNEQDPNGIYTAESLDALHQLSNAILGIEGVVRPDLMSLAEADNISQGDAGAIRFEWMMKDAPTTDAQALAIRDKVQRLPILENTLVAGDGKAAADYETLASKDLSYPLSTTVAALAE